MGMDVFGTRPKSKEGEYFGLTIWGWHPLADYVMTVAPDIASACKGWHFNDGDGLGAEESVELAKILRDEVASGRAAKYFHRRDSVFPAMPDEELPIRAGTGKRAEFLQVGLPRDFVPVIEKFAGFLESCGGFTIW